MPDLRFNVEGSEAVAYAASPRVGLKLRITETSEASENVTGIHSILLRCQVRLEPGRRRYEAGEQRRLVELFGEPQRWGQTVRSMLWTNVTETVPPFRGETVFDLQIPCTYDFNVAATKYFAALEDGEVPLTLLFSGTIFYATGEQSLQVQQIPWEKEASYRLSVRVWRGMMDLYYPNTAFLEVRQDLFDRLRQFRIARGMVTVERALESLLDGAEAAAANEGGS